MSIKTPILPIPAQDSEDSLASFLKHVPAEIQARFPQCSGYLHQLAHTQDHLTAVKSAQVSQANDFDSALRLSDLETKQGVISLFYTLPTHPLRIDALTSSTPAGKMPPIEGLPELVDHFCQKIVDELKKERSRLPGPEDDPLDPFRHNARHQVRSLVDMYSSLVNWNNPGKVRNLFYSVGPVNQATNILSSLITNPECNYRSQVGRNDLRGLLDDIKRQEEENRATISRMISHVSAAAFSGGIPEEKNTGPKP